MASGYRFFAIAGLLASGFGAATVEQTLADIQGFGMLEVLHHQGPERPLALLVIGYTPRKPGDCPRLAADTRAFVNQHPLTERSFGQANSADVFGNGGGCIHPAFVLDATAASPKNAVPDTHFGLVALVLETYSGSVGMGDPVVVRNLFAPSGKEEA